MTITDNRIPITTNDAVTGIDDATGAPAGATDNTTFIEGTGSTSDKASMSVVSLLFDFDTAQDFTGETFYMWWNVTTAGLLVSRALGGVRMRFCGATVTDYFEIYLAGNDTYSGGFTMSVVNADRAKADADAGIFGGTGGTSPAVNAIRWVGLIVDIPGNVPGNVDNCYLDAMWRLPQGQSGIIVEGSGSSVPWTWDDIVSAGDIGDTTKAWGTVKRESGIIFINTPIQFGTSGSLDHDFADTNEVIAWETQLVADDLYGFLITGSLTQITSFSAGDVVGSGDTAVGNQGWVITADAVSGTRWSLFAEPEAVDYCKFYGTTMLHGSTASLQTSSIEVRSCQFSDFGMISGSNGLIFARNTVLAAVTEDGHSFYKTDDPSEVKFNSFVFSDGHAIELQATGSFTFAGNTFANYGLDETSDAAVHNSSSGTINLSVTENVAPPTIFNAFTGSVTNADVAVNILVTCLDESSDPIEGVQVDIQLVSDGTQITNDSTDASGEVADTYNYTVDVSVEVDARSSSGATPYFPETRTATIKSTGLTLTINMREDNIIT
jgi:hypothetical protein